MATLTSSPAIGYQNLADGRTITASSSATGYAASRLANPLLSQPWKSVSGVLTSVTVDVDLGSAQSFDLVGLIGVNFQDAHTRRWRNGEDSTFAAHEHQSGASAASGFDLTYPSLLSDIPTWGRNLVYLPGSTQSSRYGRFDLNDSGNPDNLLLARVLWVGPIWQAATGMQWEWELMDDIVGMVGVERGIREWKLAYQVTTEVEARALRSVLRNKLRSGRYYIVPHPTDTATFINEAVYATLKQPARILPQPTAPRTYSVEMIFREIEGD